MIQIQSTAKLPVDFEVVGTFLVPMETIVVLSSRPESEMIQIPFTAKLFATFEVVVVFLIPMETIVDSIGVRNDSNTFRYQIASKF